MRGLLPVFVLVLGLGCSAAKPSPLPVALDASGMLAETFIEAATAHEYSAWAFFDEFGLPFAQDREGELLFLYDCHDASVALTIDRTRFAQGLVDVVEGEAY